MKGTRHFKVPGSKRNVYISNADKESAKNKSLSTANIDPDEAMQEVSDVEE